MKVADDKKLMFKISSEALEKWKFESASDENLKLLQDEIQAELRKEFSDVKAVIAEQKGCDTEVAILNLEGTVYTFILKPIEVK